MVGLPWKHSALIDPGDLPQKIRFSPGEKPSRICTALSPTMLCVLTSKALGTDTLVMHSTITQGALTCAPIGTGWLVARILKLTVLSNQSRLAASKKKREKGRIN